MKKITILAVIAVFAISVSSCDFIRQIAGRPTSQEIEAIDEAEPACCADTLCCGDTLCCPDTLCCKQMPCDSCVKPCEKACEKVCEAQPCEEKPCEEKACEAQPCDECAAPAEPVVEAVPVEKPCEAKPVCEEKPACEAKPACEEKPVCEAKPAPAPKPAACEKKPAPKAKPARIFRGPVCPKAELANKYYVVIGTFKVESNVCAQVKRAQKAGYEVVTIPFKNGLTAVTVNPTDDRCEALKTLDCIKGKKFCPKDAYVLVVK